MNKVENTTKLTATGGIVQAIIEGNTETTTEMQTVVRSIPGTLSGNGAVVPDQILEEINKDKPWREVIKRRFINGGSDN